MIIHNKKFNSPHTLLLLLALVVVLLSCTSFINCLHVQLASGRTQCFMEDLNENTQVIVSYKFPTMKTNPQNKLKVEVSDPFGNLILQKDLENWDAVVPFKSLTEVSGVYEVCFQAYLPQVRVANLEVKVEIDDDAKHYDKLESKDRLQQVDGMLEKLKDKVSYIHSDQLYFKKREERFRITSETIHTRVFWLGIVQAATLILCGIWQVTNLKSFFKQKKLA